MKKTILKRWLYGLMASLYGVAIGLTAGIGLTIATAESQDSGSSIVANRKNLVINSSYPSVDGAPFDSNGLYTGDYLFIGWYDLDGILSELIPHLVSGDTWSNDGNLKYVPIWNNYDYLNIPLKSNGASYRTAISIVVGCKPYIDGSNVVGVEGVYMYDLFIDYNARLYVAEEDLALMTSPLSLSYNSFQACVNQKNMLVGVTPNSGSSTNGTYDGSYTICSFYHDYNFNSGSINGNRLGQLLEESYMPSFSEAYREQWYSAYDVGYSAGINAGYEEAYQVGYGAGFNQGAQGQVVAVSSAYNQGYGNGYVDGLSAGKVIGYDSGYDAGYDSGYSEGVIIGYSSGYGQGVLIYNDAYESGYNYGYVTGKNVGYAQGLEANNDTSSAITSLFFSIASVPWTILNGLGAFEIWNVSIIAIALGFLVAGIIFWLIRRFI